MKRENILYYTPLNMINIVIYIYIYIYTNNQPPSTFMIHLK